MKKHLLSVVAFLFAVAVYAQTDSTQISADSVVTNPRAIPHAQSMHSLFYSNYFVFFNTLRYEYEPKISTKSTLFLNAGPSFYPTDFKKWGMGAFLQGGYRYYYSILKRAKKGKSTEANSASYLSPSLFYMVDDVGGFNYKRLLLSAGWGMRRSILKSNFYFKLETALVYDVYDLYRHKKYNYKSSYTPLILPLVELSLGYKF